MAPDEWDDDSENWPAQRGKIETALEQNGLRYFRFGRVLPQGQIPSSSEDSPPEKPSVRPPAMPTNIEEVLQVLVRGLRHEHIRVEEIEHRRLHYAGPPVSNSA